MGGEKVFAMDVRTGLHQIIATALLLSFVLRKNLGNVRTP